MSKSSRAYLSIWLSAIVVFPGPAAADSGACDLLTTAQVEAATGVKVVNVSEKDRGTFTTCSYEADSWEDTTGVILYPGSVILGNSQALAEALRIDIERDEAPYQTPVPVNDLGEAAAYYPDSDGLMHFVVIEKAGARIVVSANSKEAAFTLAGAVAD